MDQAINESGACSHGSKHLLLVRLPLEFEPPELGGQSESGNWWEPPIGVHSPTIEQEEGRWQR